MIDWKRLLSPAFDLGGQSVHAHMVVLAQLASPVYQYPDPGPDIVNRIYDYISIFRLRLKHVLGILPRLSCNNNNMATNQLNWNLCDLCKCIKLYHNRRTRRTMSTKKLNQFTQYPNIQQALQKPIKRTSISCTYRKIAEHVTI